MFNLHLISYVYFQVILSLTAMTEAFESDIKDGLRKDSHR